jgi:hypothetical protein
VLNIAKLKWRKFLKLNKSNGIRVIKKWDNGKNNWDFEGVQFIENIFKFIRKWFREDRWKLFGKFKENYAKKI